MAVEQIGRLTEGFSTLASAFSMLHLAQTMAVLCTHSKSVLARCRLQGAELLTEVRARTGGDASARGVGLCLWVDENIARLPITPAMHGRLLPRLDQTANSLAQWIDSGHAAAVAFACGLGEAKEQALAELRIPACMHCGAPITGEKLESEVDVPNSLQRYHIDCA